MSFPLRSRASWLLIPVFGSLLAASACSPSVTPPAGSGGSGGAPVTSGGGSPAVGGSPATGGSGTGGVPAVGGAPASGGNGGSSGGTPGTGGDAGSGGASGLTLVEPIMRSATSYVLEFGNTKFEVDPTQGARVVTYSLGGTNLLSPLAETAEEALNGGSTFWLSPQSAWDWPPIAAIDRDAYTPTVTGTTIDLVGPSATIETSTVHIEKSFSADLAAGAVDLTYSIHNDGAAVAPYAPWEVTRLDRGGLTFWPGAKATAGTVRWEFEPTSMDGVYWWDDSASSGMENNKVSSDGEEGWVAHVVGDILFVKTWTPVATADIAPDHGEVELYLGAGYIELEVQGPQTDIAVAGTTSFAVRWYVQPLPAQTDVSVGSAALLAAARALAP